MTAYSQPYGDPTNVVGRRIGAYVIDFLIMGIASVALIVPIFMSASVVDRTGTIQCSSDSNSFESSFETNRFESSSVNDPSICFDNGDTVRYIPAGDQGGFVAQVYAVAFGLQALNLVVLQGIVGASVGKLILGLRVVRSNGRTAGIGWAALRWVLLFVDSFCCFLPGAILVFTTKGHRRLGDMAAGTFVVRRSSVGSPVGVPGLNAPAYQAGGYPGAYPGAAPGAWGTPAPPAQPGAGTWGSPPANTGSTWAPPSTGSAPDAGSALSGEGPTWDQARNAYIQYDRDQAAWVQWNEETREWRPIDQ